MISVCLLPIRLSSKGWMAAYHLIFPVLFANCNLQIAYNHYIVKG